LLCGHVFRVLSVCGCFCFSVVVLFGGWFVVFGCVCLCCVCVFCLFFLWCVCGCGGFCVWWVVCWGGWVGVWGCVCVGVVGVGAGVGVWWIGECHMYHTVVDVYTHCYSLYLDSFPGHMEAWKLAWYHSCMNSSVKLMHCFTDR